MCLVSLPSAFVLFTEEAVLKSDDCLTNLCCCETSMHWIWEHIYVVQSSKETKGSAAQKIGVISRLSSRKVYGFPNTS